MSCPEIPVLATLVNSLGRNEAWARLYPLASEMVRVALKLGPMANLHPENQDLVVEAVYAALGNVERYRAGFRGQTEGEARGWLWMVCRNAAWRQARRARRQAQDIPTEAADLEELLNEQAGTTPDLPITPGAARRIVERAIPNADWRHIWFLYNDPDAALNHDQIAAATNRTRGSVEVTLSRVRRALEREPG